MRIAAVDIGTVTTRLLVADVSDSGIEEIERHTDITHLGSGLTERGTLSPEAMGRVADVIGSYSERVTDLGVSRVRAVTTSAARDAGNSEEFLALLESRGIRPEVIAGEVEAALSFSGATQGSTGENLLVVDVGGGSTELVMGSVGSVGSGAPAVQVAHSYDVGSRRLTEMYLRSDPPGTEEVQRVAQHAASEMGEFFAGVPMPVEMVSVAGTATTLAAIAMEMEKYDPARIQGFLLTRQLLSEIIGRLSEMSLERRKQVVGLHPDRASVIVAGAIILETALKLSGLDCTTVSDQDILYGILLETYRRP